MKTFKKKKIEFKKFTISKIENLNKLNGGGNSDACNTHGLGVSNNHPNGGC